MKRFIWPDYFSAILLSLTIGLGVSLMPLSAFSLSCRLGLFLGCMALGAAVLPLLFWPRRQLPLWAGFWLLLLTAGYFGREDLWNALRYTLLTLSEKFSLAYPGLQSLDIGHGLPPWSDATSLFIVVGILTELCVQWTVLRRQTMLPVAFLGLCSLTLSCLDLSSFSAASPVLLLLAGLLILALTQGVRRSGRAVGRLTLLFSLPVALLLGLLYLTNPQPTYVRSTWSDGLEGQVMATLARLPFLTMENGTLQFSAAQFSAYFNTSAVNLHNVGPKVNTGQEVMEILSGKNGPLYLRGASLGDYTGSSWETISGRDQGNANVQTWTPAPLWTLEQRSIDVRSQTVSGVLYSPYHPSAVTGSAGETGTACYDICLKNTAHLSEYTVFYGETGWNPTGVEGDALQVLQAMTTYRSSSLKDLEEWCGKDFSVPSTALHESTMGQWLQANEDYGAFVQAHYTTLPTRTQRGLRSIIQREGLDQVTGAAQGIPDRAAQAFAVADYVRSSARYDLNTPKMPLGQDFVLWFLNSSDTGYCVHFASATVALLRAMGIPARYVAGYLVDGTRGSWTPVTTDDAHAWAEFYLPGLGWVPLESTPGTASDGFGRGLSTPSVTVPQESQPEPPTTEPSLEPTTETVPVTTAPASTSPTSPTADSSAVGSPTVPGRLPGGSSAGTDTGPSGPGLLQRIGAALLRILPYVLWPLGLLLALYLRRLAHLTLRRQRVRHMDENRAAVYLYLRLVKLSKAVGLPPPKELTDLAQRARFSQHHLTRQELQPLYRFQHSLVAALKKRSRLRRLWDQWVLVRY